MRAIRHTCPAEYDPAPPEDAGAGYLITCTMLPDHKGLHVDPSGLLWAPTTQEGYRRATEMR